MYIQAYIDYPTTDMYVVYERVPVCFVFCVCGALVGLVLRVPLEEELSLPGRHGCNFGHLSIPLFLLLLFHSVGSGLLISPFLHNVPLPCWHTLQGVTCFTL